MARQTGVSKNVRAALRLSWVAFVAAWLWGCESTATKGGAERSTIASLSTDERKRYDEALANLANAQPKPAEQELSQLARRWPDIAEIWLNLALSQYQQDDLGKTKKTLTVLASRSNDVAQAHNLAGVIAVKEGDFVKAEMHYEKAINLKPDYSHALYNMALLQDVYLQDIASAVDYYQRYLQLAPEDTDTKGWAEGLKMSLGR